MQLTLGVTLDNLGTTLCEIPDIHFKEILYIYIYTYLHEINAKIQVQNGTYS